MRITGGELCGRRLKVPGGLRFRPTQDRVREALGSLLAAALPGASFLDLFAGSGAVGLEALSRGAARVAWVESDRLTWQVLRANVEALGGDPAQTFCADVMRWLTRLGAGAVYDIVYADPPYDRSRQTGMTELMQRLVAQRVLAPGGLFVAEQPEDAGVAPVDGWELLRDRGYGKSRIVIYRQGTTVAPMPGDVAVAGENNAQESGISGDV